MLASVCVASLTLSSCNKDGGGSEPAIYGKWQAVKSEYVSEDGAANTEYVVDGELYIYEFRTDGSVRIHEEFNWNSNGSIHRNSDMEGTFQLTGNDLTMTISHGTYTDTYEDGRTETEEYTGEPATFNYKLHELTSNEMVLYQEIGGERAYGYFKRIN